MQPFLEKPLHNAIKTKKIGGILNLLNAGEPITSEVIHRVLQTQDSKIARLFTTIIQKNKNIHDNSGNPLLQEQIHNLLIQPSTVNLINQAIQINDFDFSLLALSLDPQMTAKSFLRLEEYRLANRSLLFTDSLIKLNEENILTNDNVKALVSYMAHNHGQTNCCDIADCFIALYEADLLDEDNRRLIINNPDHCFILVDTLKELNEAEPVSDESRQLIIQKAINTNSKTQPTVQNPLRYSENTARFFASETESNTSNQITDAKISFGYKK